MSAQSTTITALTAWRENRGGGYVGMQSVANVIQNRSRHSGASLYAECIKPLQFSSITAHGDPQLALWPHESDPQWVDALQIAAAADAGELRDITFGSTLYFNPEGIGPTVKTFTLPDGTTIRFPQSWNPAAVTFKVMIARHYFFTE